MKKKTVLITGASGDIGHAICLEFANNGYNIVYHYNSKMDEIFINTLSAITSVLPVKADFTKQKEIENLANKAIKTFGQIDCLVNNAGISSTSLIIDESFESISTTMQINLLSTVYLTKLISTNMCNFQSGTIINISSIWGVYGGASESVYSASKAGIIGFTKALAKELGTNNIRVNCVAPGLIDTKMNNNLTQAQKAEFATQTSLSRIGTSTEVAKAVFFLASGNSSFITGQTIGVDGGFC